MSESLINFTHEEIQALPADRLGMIVLEHIVETKEWSAHNFLPEY